MANVKNNVVAQETRRKLLDAAGELFAERGVHGTTIQQITNLADLSIAAVNYHFRDKFELYAAVVKSVMEKTAADHVVPSDTGEGTAPQRLRRFVRQFLKSLLAAHSIPPWKPMLMMREMTQPTAAFERVVEAVLKPLMERLEPLVREILGERASAEKVELCMHSILGQCSYYLVNRSIVERFHPHLLRKGYDLLADHIVDFSLGALTCDQNASPRGARDHARRGSGRAPAAQAPRHRSSSPD